MKPRWVIGPAPALGQGHARWVWFRRDRSGRFSCVGCVCCHSWTKIVRRFEVVP